MVDLQEDIRKYFLDLSANVNEDKGLVKAELVVAERKASGSKKKLTYVAKCRIHQAKRELRFTETLQESGWGISGGDIQSSPGLGFKIETYKTGMGAREGSMEERSNFFGKEYSYSFDFTKIRGAIEEKAKAAGFTFKYRITSIGL